ncbi:c-type cytochrome biogenesis protein CcmI [Devosia nitrariae]|uniref:Cytochrome c-type biogenesis protein CycH n=1 Tax=Devosia nitrariae TaxID=2071872 RepID=A0ABQ5W5J1_9HYPH|nr:c-type cytochrome biogenesis protein CcmI [Devosia nitrariae]GLQ55061.1 cytochrome c-type biogenesis protein CycH [Devosia nitrariae]
MVFWSIAITITLVACAALYYAAAMRPVNAVGSGEGLDAQFARMLAGIEADVGAGKLAGPQAIAAKAELAREMLRQKSEAGQAPTRAKPLRIGVVAAGVMLIAGLACGLYAILGRPDLPGEPLASRPEIAARNMNLEEAIARIEARLAIAPDDLRGWTVIAPAYMELQRYADAERAFRRIVELAGPDADRETDLAEALMMQAGGDAAGEAMQLLRSAATRDPAHLRSRFYIAGELTRTGDYTAAVEAWQELIGLAEGNEPWLATARQGLAFAEAGGVAPQDDETQQEAIRGMVEGLAARLQSEGGSVEEWTQLVRAYLVLEDRQAAQAAYEDAVAAYPQAFDRGGLDTLALGAGLSLNGDGQ